MFDDVAATNLRKSFYRSASGSVLKMPAQGHTGILQEDAEGNGSAGPNEHTSLLERHISRITTNEEGTPYYKDDRAWVRWPFLCLHLSYEILKTNYVNILLVFVPLGIIAGALKWDPTAVFILNFLAIIPLASLLAFATEELSVPLGQTIGGLLNATFGNAVELIVSIVALRNNQLRIVQASMLGSILSNILLVLGCCFIAGGIEHSEQKFNSTVASTMSSLMSVSTASLIIPAALHATLTKNSGADTTMRNILVLSRATAIILLFIYIMYLVFQLKTHTNLFAEADDSTNAEAALLTPWTAGVVLVIITLAVAVCAEYLVDSIDSIVETAHISRTFIGLILIPIVGNAAEHVTAVVVAYKNKMGLAIGVAIGSSLQIALFVTPFLVILGWIMDKDLTLHFEMFETVAFFLAALVVTLLIQDGKSNYLEGVMCLGMYTIIAVAFYVYPDEVDPDSLFFLGGS